MKDCCCLPQYVEYLREVKRWLEAEEKAVLIALKKKEDARVRRSY